MSNEYILHMTDRTEEDHIMPPPPHDPYPQHPLGTFITIRILSPNTDPLSSTEFDTSWEYIRTRQSFANIMAGGQGWWWEESQKWLQPKESPDEVSGEEFGRFESEEVDGRI